MRPLFPSTAAAVLFLSLCGLLLVLSCGGKTSRVADASLLQRAVTSTPPDLRRLVHAMADPALRGREEGSEGGRIVREFLVKQLRACGVEPAGAGGGYLQEITTGEGVNVLGRIKGRGELGGAGPLISAHYDHQDLGGRVHPGAYDNATAVAAVLHAACSLAAAPPERSVMVAFWDAEEPPTFLSSAMGSRYFVENPTVPLSSISTAIILDLVGAGLWDGLELTFIMGSESAPQLGPLLAAAEAGVAEAGGAAGNAAFAGPALMVPVDVGLHLAEEMIYGKHQVWSDYDAFRRKQIPFLFVTDGQNKRYHTPKDTADRVDYPKLAAQTRWLERLTGNIANAQEIPAWTLRDDYHRDWVRTRQLLERILEADVGLPAEAIASLKTSAKELSRDKPEGAVFSDVEILAMRRAAQKAMCWLGPFGSAITCGML